MRQPVDVLVDSAVGAVASSGLIDEVARMGTVAVVNPGGTIEVDVEDGEIPSVRMLSTHYSPAAGDLVEIMRTSGGWVCLGRISTGIPSGAVVDMRAGVVSVPVASGAANNIGSADISFPAVRGDSFYGVATINSGSLQLVAGPPGITSVTSTSATVYVRRTASGNNTNVHWAVFGVKE